MPQIILNDINIEIVYKNIKNLYMRVYSQSGKVRITAPLHMELDTIKAFAVSKMKWIMKQQNNIKSKEREAPRKYITRESHLYLGKRYLLKVIEHRERPKVVLKHEIIEMYIRANSSSDKRKKVLYEWYRQRLKNIIPAIIHKYESTMKIKIKEFAIKKMKTRWGTCNIKAKRIWINLELAKKPKECIEYIVAHEMVHLLERYHNQRFTAYMDNYLPKWRLYKEVLTEGSLNGLHEANRDGLS